MKVSALLLDFDGTLSRVDVLREDAKIPRNVASALTSIGEQIPVAIITTKDLSFIVRRTCFARAWAGISGLEIRIGQERYVDPKALEKFPLIDDVLQDVIDRVKEISGRIYIEKKKTMDGQVAAFCLDWRSTPEWSTAQRRLEPLLEYCERKGLQVVRYPNRPYADIYPIKVDKGTALLKLKNQLWIKGLTMYMGDSEADNPAFTLADIPIGVLHEETPATLSCKYFVRFAEVGKFLEELLRNGLFFDQGFTTVIKQASLGLQWIGSGKM